MDILTNTISLLFRPRQKEIARFAQDADAIQHKQLKSLLSTARNTEWGLKYDYKSIQGYADFCERIPLQTYDDIKPYVTRMINGERNILWPSVVRWYAKSSGTTNDKSKFLPVTPEILKGCHYKGGFDTVSIYLQNNPDRHFFASKGLILGGSHSPSHLNRNAHSGDLYADLNSLSGVPSWMLVLIKAVLQKTGSEYLTDVWPNMEVFFHGGISFEPYRDQYKALIPSDRMHYMETYNASEGFFGLQDNPEEHSLLLMIDYSVFYEFIPINEVGEEHPTVLPLEAVEVGKNYAMVITTSGGLWRYQIGDTVRFTSLYPHKFVISGRTKNFINAFGEELMVDNADKAISRVCRQTGAKVKEYTAAPLFMLDKAKGRHQWMIEFEKMPPSLDDFASLLDKTLQQLNSDYEAKRYKEISLQPLEIRVAREGTFYEWLRRKGKLGGQHKIPRLSNDRTFIEELGKICDL